MTNKKKKHKISVRQPRKGMQSSFHIIGDIKPSVCDLKRAGLRKLAFFPVQRGVATHLITFSPVPLRFSQDKEMFL